MQITATTIDQTELHVWSERDRNHIELRCTDTDATIIEWWDDDAIQAIENGFLNPKNLHQSAFDYAAEMGLL